MNEFLWRATVFLIATALGLIGYHFALCAVVDIGDLFGWIIGASKSPIAATVAPLVFGLLGSVVFASVYKVAVSADAVAVAKDLVSVPGLPDSVIRASVKESWRRVLTQLVFAVVILNLASHFVYHARLGIHDGSQTREDAGDTP